MELVKGIPLTEYCDQNRLSLGERLGLFRQICSAVHHAHQKGIIHRDLKPSNILVESHDGKPVPKVIDFGLAKAVSGMTLTENTLFTALGTVAGTPLYMAPEQAAFNAIDIDTRADTFALGVILYELLTGSTPITRDMLKKAGFDELLRVVREQEPPTPSKRISTSEALPTVAANRQMEPVKLGRFVKGDLDWIVMKALAKERDRRYESATAFAQDIERFLNHEPVSAGPPTVGYKLRKFVKRNKLQVVAGSLVLTALVLGICGTSFGLWRAEIALRDEAEQRRIADEERTKAEEEKKKAIEFRDKALDALRATTTLDVEKLIGEKKELGRNERDYLEAIAKRWQVFANQEGTDEQSRAVRAEGHHRVGRLWLKLGRQEEARREYEQAVAIRKKIAAEFPGVIEYRQELAWCHNDLGKLLVDLGKQLEGEEQYRKALAIKDRLATEFPAVPEYRLDLASGHNNLGILLADLGKPLQSEKQYRRALVIQEELATKFPAVPEYRLDLAMSHNNLGKLLDDSWRWLEAEEHYRQARSIREKLADEFPSVPEYRQDLASSHNNLGKLLAGLGKRFEAEELYRMALAIQEKLADEFPSVPAYRQELARSHNNLGELLRGLGKRFEAGEQYRKALAIQEKLATEFPAVHEYQQDLASSHRNLGNLLPGLGKRFEAEEQYRKALAIGEKLVAEFPGLPAWRRGLAGSHNNLGLLLAGLGKRLEAEEQYRKAMAIYEKLADEFPSVPAYRLELGCSYLNFGSLVHDTGKPAESLEWFDKAIGALRPIWEREPRNVNAIQALRNIHWGRAVAYDNLRKFSEAVADWDKAIELSSPVEKGMMRAARANSRVQAGQVAEAIAEVAELTMSEGWPATEWYNFACVYSVANGKIADKKQEYADRAMELLHKAVQAGWKDAAHMAKDSDLDSLRDREDFKKLMGELQAAAKTPKKP
jgi:tetratricopeptide (TPR) repeat protein